MDMMPLAVAKRLGCPPSLLGSRVLSPSQGRNPKFESLKAREFILSRKRRKFRKFRKKPRRSCKLGSKNQQLVSSLLMERIYVTVRPKPVSVEDSKTTPWRISGNSISLSPQSTKFEFDHIFREECKTAEVYEARTKDIVSAAVRGFNGTVFAYGQTNSGKTHTMRGSAAEPGVIPLAVRDLFRTILEDGDREFLLRMSYMEIYNEEINDLLAPENRKLQIHESIERGIFVAGLREEIVASPEQVLGLMEFGESHRHFGETNMNIYSSRSHTIFRMIIESRDRTEDGDLGSSCDAVRVSVLSLVDLAGSERAAKTGAEGMRLKEGSHINKSLMTLGTVIKKLSEGVESQGGHVPYRDSKLTRILQPSLGGNANTAIICNITLAQIHADETKSSLQFASRALRVTNCARVNEILTDAALLKRQKKEIEELREKLQGSHSEHFEEEILNLRNTLLKSELERERIALELEEEKKAQALRERRLQEQAKKIENLSSMVLNSNLEEKRSPYKKEKRRDTWCPGVLARKTLRREVSSTAQLEASIEESIRNERDMGLPLPFEELTFEDEVVGTDNPQNNCLQDEKGNGPPDNCLMDQNGNNDLPGNFVPVLHVTNRRKVPVKKKITLAQENSEGVEMHAEYEDLFLQLETQGTTKDIEIECLTKKVSETGLQLEAKNFCPHTYQLSGSTVLGDGRESEEILLIKQLQEQIKMLEMEKSSIQQNLNSVVELAKEKKASAEVMHDEHCQEASDALKEAEVAQQQPSPEISIRPIEEVNGKSIMEISTEVQGIMLEFQSSRNVVESILTVVDELFGSFSDLSNMFLGLKSYASLNSTQLKTIISDHETMHSCMKKKIYELESDKSILYNQSIDLEKQIEELRLDLQESGMVLMEHRQLQELKEDDFLCQIEKLEKEISCLSSCSLAKEKEMLRKEHEKTKAKLKEAEAKLKNAIQDKTKLVGDKAQAEREIKQLHSQKTLLERDLSKRDSIAGSRRESFVDRRRDSFADRRQETKMQGEYKKLEVLAFEMETTIASLEEELAASNAEKQEAYFKNESLASEMEAMSMNLSTASSELELLQEEVSSMKTRLADSEVLHQKMETTVNLLLEEKEELANQLAEALLGLEEEKAIWSAKEKASIEAIAEKAKLSDMELMLLSNETLEVRHELESLREQYKILAERLALSEESAEWERKCRMEKSGELDQLRNEIKISESENENCQNILRSKFEMLSLEHRDACAKVEKLQADLSALDMERHKLLAQIEEMREGLDHTRDFQVLQDQLLIISTERDKLSAQNEEQQKLVMEFETIKKNYDDMLSKARVDVEELTRQLSSMELKMQQDSQSTNIVKIKLRMSLRGCQAKLDAHRGRYKEAIDEMGVMHKNYTEASKKLKDLIALKGGEILHLKRQLAAANVHQNSSII